MAPYSFDKFKQTTPTGAKKKEAIKQEKRKLKAAININPVIGESSTLKNKDYTKQKIEKQTHKWIKATNISTKNKDTSFHTATPKQKETKNTTKRTTYKQPSNKYVQSNSDKYFAKNTILTAPTTTTLDNKPSSTLTPIPLNKFIAHAGICGRREAAIMVKQGFASVNGDIVYEPGYKVTTSDNIQLKGKKLSLQKNLVYILLNKPKDFITTANDPEGRKTVLSLVATATKERVFAVGRLDRNTTGVLLLTNDGDLAQQLTHPSFQVKKIYEVKLNKPLLQKDLTTIANGITLDDGFVQPDNIAYADAKDNSIIGIEIHSGKNRIVRRIFEKLGYDVKNLDRVMFAILTKKNVDRGKWRLLTTKEVQLLKYKTGTFPQKK